MRGRVTELVRLARNRPKIGMVTAAGVMFLSLFFLWRLNPDRRFSGATAEPTRGTSATHATTASTHATPMTHAVSGSGRCSL